MVMFSAVGCDDDDAIAVGCDGVVLLVLVCCG